MTPSLCLNHQSFTGSQKFPGKPMFIHLGFLSSQPTSSRNKAGKPYFHLILVLNHHDLHVQEIRLRHLNLGLICSEPIGWKMRISWGATQQGCPLFRISWIRAGDVSISPKTPLIESGLFELQTEGPNISVMFAMSWSLDGGRTRGINSELLGGLQRQGWDVPWKPHVSWKFPKGVHPVSPSHHLFFMGFSNINHPCGGPPFRETTKCCFLFSLKKLVCNRRYLERSWKKAWHVKKTWCAMRAFQKYIAP